MHEVVPSAVSAAVSAAIAIRSTASQNPFFFIRFNSSFFILHSSFKRVGPRRGTFYLPFFEAAGAVTSTVVATAVVAASAAAAGSDGTRAAAVRATAVRTAIAFTALILNVHGVVVGLLEDHVLQQCDGIDILKINV